IRAASAVGPNGFPMLPNGITAKILPLNSDGTMRLPALDTWNLTIERQLSPTMALSVAYVGNKEEHVTPGGSQYNINQPFQPAVAAGAQLPASPNPYRFYFQKFGWTQ